jgi:hypothetical protein
MCHRSRRPSRLPMISLSAEDAECFCVLSDGLLRSAVTIIRRLVAPSVRVLMMAVRRMRVRVPDGLVSMPMTMRLGGVDGFVMRVIMVFIM